MRPIRALALDFDGVLTDGGVWWGPDGDEWKRVSFRDIMGLSLACKAGLHVALISGEGSPQVKQLGRKFQLAHVHLGCKDKAAALRDFAVACGCDLMETAFMGDDVNDVAAMTICGLPAVPADAHAAARAVARFVADHAGGQGAVRDLVDHLLAPRPAG